MESYKQKSLVDSVDEIIEFVSNCNSNFSESKHCLFDLENSARNKLCDLIKCAISNIYNVEFDEKDCSLYLYKQLSRPKHGRGDITLPCFQLSKPLKSKPNKIAQEIVDEICLGDTYPFKIIKAENGRINAYLSAGYLGKIINLILDSNNCYLSVLPSNGERVMVEYSQPNTHKAFHVGHMRNVALGDCLVRLYEHCGYDTVAANYFGDEGSHVAKCLWLLQKQIDGIDDDDDGDDKKIDLDFIEKNIKNKGEWLGNKYAEAVNKLTLSTYTKFPYIGVIVAKILSINKHPHNNKWNIVEVEYYADNDDGNIKKSTVVYGGTLNNDNVGNLVAYIPVGERYKDKITEKKDMKGIISEGIIMSAIELGIKLKHKKKEEKEEKKEDDNGKKKKKKKNKNKVNDDDDDDRIYLIDEFYPNAKIGDKLTELGKYDDYKNINDVVELWQNYISEQQNVLKLLESGDPKWVSLWERTKKWSLDEFHEIYKWVGARFDHDFTESECSADSRKLVEEYYNKGIFVKSDGAIGIHLDVEKLGFCMLLKSNGSGLYATKDLSLAKKKFEKFNIDRSIYVVDSSQSHHFKQVFATLNRMGYEQASKCYHLQYAFVRLADGKMATRTGNIILFSDLVKLLATEINDKYLNKLKNEWNENELAEAERAISVGAIRYGMLNHDNNKEIIFDLKKWTLSSGNTGPYLMYQYARISSIGNKIKYPSNIKIKNIDYSVLENSNIAKTILFELSQFQKKVKQTCQDKSPSQLCDYLYSICKLFSQWYSNPKNSIKNCNDNHLKAVRLQFCKAVAKTIKVGIQLLGITPLDRM